MALPPVAEKKAWYPEIQQNTLVRHPKFGLGKVVARFGEDELSKAIVKFQEEGEKRLSLKYAKLVREAVEEEQPAAGAQPDTED